MTERIEKFLLVPGEISNKQTAEESKWDTGKSPVAAAAIAFSIILGRYATAQQPYVTEVPPDRSRPRTNIPLRRNRHLTRPKSGTLTTNIGMVFTRPQHFHTKLLSGDRISLLDSSRAAERNPPDGPRNQRK